MFKENKYSSLIISLLVLLDTNDGRDIQVPKSPFLGIFKGIMLFHAVSLTCLQTTIN